MAFGRKNKDKESSVVELEDVTSVDTSTDTSEEVDISIEDSVELDLTVETSATEEINNTESPMVDTDLSIGDNTSTSNLDIDISMDSFIEELDDVDFGDTATFIQEGVYYDKDAGVVNIEDELFDGLVEADGYYNLDTGKKDKDGKTVYKKVKVKRYRRKRSKQFEIGVMTEENFGDMLPFIQDINVTDINWNGKQLWIDDVTRGRYVADVELDEDFVKGFSVRVSNVVSRPFNKYTPELEAETDDLRITVLHESISHTGRAISIRKTPAIKRITFEDSILHGDYCPIKVADFISNSVKAKMNIAICGLPGVGKTELVKYLTSYIFKRDRVISVEDTLELRYSDINPGKDCLEIKVSPTFTYTDAIKASLRLLPQWILLSEARSVEVKYLLESVSTGTKCITTLHTDDVRKVPDRIVQMIGDATQADTIKNSVHSFFDIAILIDKRIDPNDGGIHRWISQICLFNRENDENSCKIIYDDGELFTDVLPDSMLKRYEINGIKDPFTYTFIKED